MKVKLLTFFGEYFLNTEYGIPYFQQIFGKQRDKGTVDSIFQKQILAEEGVIRIAEFESTLTKDRGYYLSFSVVVDDGTTTGTVAIGVNI